MWEERKEELDDTFENTFCKFLRQRKGQEGWTVFLDTIISQEKEMIWDFAIEIFDNNDNVMIHKHILNDRINKLLKDRGIKEI